MALPQQKFREIVFQILFSVEFSRHRILSGGVQIAQSDLDQSSIEKDSCADQCNARGLAVFGLEDLEETALMLMSELKVTKRSVLEARDKVLQILANLAQIDEKIRGASSEYQLERISLAEKCALRLGLFELLYEPALPFKIAIAEAIRLTRKFGTAEGAHFVNAILDGIYTRSTQRHP